MVWCRSYLFQEEIIILKLFGKKNELQARVEQLPDVIEENELSLIEIKDEKVISRLKSAVPQLASMQVHQHGGHNL